MCICRTLDFGLNQLKYMSFQVHALAEISSVFLKSKLIGIELYTSENRCCFREVYRRTRTKVRCFHKKTVTETFWYFRQFYCRLNTQGWRELDRKLLNDITSTRNSELPSENNCSLGARIEYELHVLNLQVICSLSTCNEHTERTYRLTWTRIPPLKLVIIQKWTKHHLSTSLFSCCINTHRWAVWNFNGQRW